MKIIIKTQSGSKYELHYTGEKLYIRQGIAQLTGEVVKTYGKIEIGEPLHVDFIKDGLYGTPDSDPMSVKTTPIVDIEIKYPSKFTL